VHEMILRMPQGYDTPLGEGGAGLSGGQKQRLGLARAMYDDPSLIVLDEPNSNLDEVGEQGLVLAIDDLRRRGKTIVMITHRSSVLAATNKILLLLDGLPRLFGPSAEVMAELINLNRKPPAAQQEPIDVNEEMSTAEARLSQAATLEPETTTS
jgi:ATP-binding cassette subfamily C exporter for protease/lipase